MAQCQSTFKLLWCIRAVEGEQLEGNFTTLAKQKPKIDTILTNILSQINWIQTGTLELCKLENEILKVAKNAQNHSFRPKNVIFEQF